MDPAVQNGYDGPVTIVGATYEQFATEGETKASFNENGTFGWETAESAKFETTNGWYESTAQDISADKSKCSFQIVGDLSTDMVAVLPADINPARYDAQSTNDGLKVTIPASRTWVKDQSYATMLGFGANNGGNTSYSFSHLGGLAKIKVNGVPANATKFVFKTKGFKISGDFEAGKINTSGGQTISTVTASSDATATDDFTEDEETYSLTFTSDDISSNNGVMEFNVPLPCETYSNGFAFCFKDNGGTVIYSFVGSSPQKVERTDRLCLPTINIVGGGGENLPTKSVQNIPAGYKGDFLLAEAENVLLKIAPETNANDINLKYNSGQKPSNLEINIVDGETAGTFAGTISGILPDTHVDFTKGTIANVSMTTSTSTFEIIYPATISSKLTVTGGNVAIKGATVGAIEVAEGAKASEETQAPVQIVVEKSDDATPVNPSVGTITANADVVVANESSVDVIVDAAVNVQVANEGAGTVKDKSEQPIETKATAKIGDIKYFTLADAVKAAPTNATEATTITLLENVTDGAGIFLADTDKKNIIIDMDGHSYTGVGPAVGSTGTSNQLFHIEKGNTFTLKNSDSNQSSTVSIDSEKANLFRFIIQNYADLTLEDVTIDGTGLSYNEDGKDYTYALSNNCGTVYLNGTTSIKASTTSGMNNYAFDVCKYASYDAPTVTWNSTGSVDGIIELSGGEFVVAKNLALTRPIRTNSKPAILTINQNATISQSGAFPTVHTKFTGDSESLNENNSGLVIVNYGGDLTIKGAGTIEATQGCTAAVCMTEKKEVYSNADAKLKVENVTLKGKGIGITGNGGRHNTVIVINNAKIYGTSTDETDEAVGLYHPQEGTLTINGSNTIIQGLASGVEMRAGTLTVNDGTIEGTATTYSVKSNGNGSTTVGAGLSVAPHTTGKNINVTINGGTFKGAKAFSNTNPEEQPSHVNITINGGTFSDLSGVNYVADNGTYKLANAVTLANPIEITSGKTFTVDLNSKTLTGRTNISGANVTFKNGTVAGGQNQAINIYGSESEVSNYSVVTISNDVTVTADVYAVCVFGKYNGVGVGAGTKGYGAVANIAGTINTTGDSQNGAVFVSGNLGAKDDTEFAVSSKNKVNIKKTAKITSEKDAAIALNGSATVTVDDGAELTGATAIAAKRGKLIVNGGTITGTMDPGKSNPTTYMNGTEMTGSAVSATASYKADGPLSVEIEDGTFTSKAYTILNNHDGCEFKISGGDFTTTMDTNGITVYARLGSVNITGGEFINNSNGEATLHVGCPTANLTNGPKLTISGDGTVVKNTAEGSYTHNTSWSPLTVNMANELTYKAVDISGGTFHGQNPEKDDSWTSESDAHKYFLATGYAVSGDETNGWTVVSANQN